MTATVPRTPAEIDAKRLELVARARALGWSQNTLARKAKKDVGHFSRVLRGLLVAAPTWIAAERALLREERRRSRTRAA